MHDLLLGMNPYDMIVPGIGIIEKIVRPAVVYFVLVTGLRLAGKREMAQLNPFDMVVLFTLSNAVQNAIIGNDNSVSGGIIGAATLLVLNHFTVKALYGNSRLQRLFEGEPDMLISNGKIRMKRLEKELITVEELAEAAHKQGIDSLSEVKSAVLDPDGVISFVAHEPTPEIQRHAEIMRRLDQITGEIETMKKQMKRE